MKKNGLEYLLNIGTILIATIILLFVSWLLFDGFGFSCEKPWQFMLFLVCFLVLDMVFEGIEEWIEFQMVKHRVIEGFWQVTICHAMLNLLIALASLLILRFLPGIEISSMQAYYFALFWGVCSLAIDCWDEWGPKSDE